jgi:hypothetical protein
MKGRKTGGRKRGTPNKHTLRTMAVADEALASGRSPLKIMIENMRFADENADKLLADILARRKPGQEADVAKQLGLLKTMLDFRQMAHNAAKDAAPYCHHRLVPLGRVIKFKLAKIECAADAIKASGAIVAAVAAGEITPSEAEELSKVVDSFTRAVEAADFEARLVKLEKAHDTRQR